MASPADCRHMTLRDSAGRPRLRCGVCLGATCLDCLNQRGAHCPVNVFDFLVSEGIVAGKGEEWGTMRRGRWVCVECQRNQAPDFYPLGTFLSEPAVVDSRGARLTLTHLQALGMSRDFMARWEQAFIPQSPQPPPQEKPNELDVSQLDATVHLADLSEGDGMTMAGMSDAGSHLRRPAQGDFDLTGDVEQLYEQHEAHRQANLHKGLSPIPGLPATYPQPNSNAGTEHTDFPPHSTPLPLEQRGGQGEGLREGGQEVDPLPTGPQAEAESAPTDQSPAGTEGSASGPTTVIPAQRGAESREEMNLSRLSLVSSIAGISLRSETAQGAQGEAGGGLSAGEQIWRFGQRAGSLLSKAFSTGFLAEGTQPKEPQTRLNRTGMSDVAARMLNVKEAEARKRDPIEERRGAVGSRVESRVESRVLSAAGDEGWSEDGGAARPDLDFALLDARAHQLSIPVSMRGIGPPHKPTVTTAIAPLPLHAPRSATPTPARVSAFLAPGLATRVAQSVPPPPPPLATSAPHFPGALPAAPGQLPPAFGLPQHRPPAFGPPPPAQATRQPPGTLSMPPFPTAQQRIPDFGGPKDHNATIEAHPSHHLSSTPSYRGLPPGPAPAASAPQAPLHPPPPQPPTAATPTAAPSATEQAMLFCVQKCAEMAAQMATKGEEKKSGRFYYDKKKLEAEHFDGTKVWLYQAWRTQLKTMGIEDQKVPEDVRILTVKSLLKGKARAKVEAFPAQPGYLAIILGVLDKEYSSSASQIAANYNRMEKLEPLKQDLSNLEAFIDELRSTVLALTFLHEGVDDAVVEANLNAAARRILADSLIPRNVFALITTLRQQGGEDIDSPPAMSDLMRYLDVLKSREKAVQAGVGGGAKKSAQPKAQPKAQAKSEAKQPEQHVSTAFFANARGASSGLKCAFCSEPHRNVECTNFPTVSSRKTFCLDNHKCFGCLRDYAPCRANGCPAKRTAGSDQCKSCPTAPPYHHAALCPARRFAGRGGQGQQGQSRGGRQQSRGRQPRGSSRPPPRAPSSDPYPRAFPQQSSQPQPPQQFRQPQPGPARRFFVNAMKMGGTSKERGRTEAGEGWTERVDDWEELTCMCLIPEVTVKNHVTGLNEKVAVLVDGGSTASAIRMDVAEGLGLSLGPANSIQAAVFGTSEERTLVGRETELELEGLYGASMNVRLIALNALTTDSMSQEPLPLSDAQINRLNKLNVVNRPDGKSYQIAVILGIAEYTAILHPRNFVEDLEISRDNKSLMIFNTIFGPLIYGCIRRKKALLSKKAFRRTQQSLMMSEKDLYKRYMMIEGVGLVDDGEPMKPAMSEEERRAEENFVKTTYFRGKEIVVSLPLRYPNLRTSDNKHQAVARLQKAFDRMSVEERLFADANFARLLREGITRLVGKDEKLPGQNFFIPFFFVNSSSKTTPRRMVLDSAAKNSEGYSQNSLLLPGPPLLHSLVKLICLSRFDRVSWSADLKSAFNALAIDEGSQGMLQVVWTSDPCGPFAVDKLITFAFTHLPFGPSPGPFLLCRALQFLADQIPSDYSAMLKGRLYMDDLIAGGDDEAEVEAQMRGLTELVAKASFSIRKFACSSKEVTERIPEELRVAEGPIKLLGYVWDRFDKEGNVLDTYSLRGFRKLDIPEVITPRFLQRIVPQLFDPTGIVSCLKIKLKLLQHEAQINFSMDAPLPEELQEQCRRELVRANEIREIKIPRFIASRKQKISLIACSDATRHIAAGAIYTHQTIDGITKVNLLFARDRIVKFKETSAPKAEAAGVYIARKLVLFVVAMFEEAGIELDKVVQFTDSKVILQAVLNQRPMHKFFENRLGEMREKKVDFRYWPGANLPADFMTRGLAPSKYLHSIVPHGPPEWNQPFDNIPVFDVPDIPDEDYDFISSQAKKVNVYFGVITRNAAKLQKAKEKKAEEDAILGTHQKKVRFTLPRDQEGGGRGPQPSAPPLPDEYQDLERTRDALDMLELGDEFAELSGDEEGENGEDEEGPEEPAVPLPPHQGPTGRRRPQPGTLPDGLRPTQVAPNFLDINIGRFSSYQRLIRATVCVRRAADIWLKRRPKQKKGVEFEMEDEEMDWAKLGHCKATQRQFFAKTVKALEEGKTDREALELNLFIEKGSGLVRLRGRIEKSDLPYQSKHPIILFRQAYYTKLLFKFIHEHLCLHDTNPNAFVANLHQFYFVPEELILFRQTLKACAACTKVRLNPAAKTFMPDLPGYRVRRAPCLSQVSLDYGGPLTTLDRGQLVKRWVCVVVCEVTSAMKILLIRSYSAKDFWLSLQTLANTVGRIQQIRCDNFASFTKVDKYFCRQFGEWDANGPEVQDWRARAEEFKFKQGIKFIHPAPGDPEGNSLAERAVKRVKDTLKVLAGRKVLDETETLMLLSQLERYQNSIPIGSVSIKGGPSEYLSAAFFLSPSATLGYEPVPKELRKEGFVYRRYDQLGKELADMARDVSEAMDAIWKAFYNQVLLDHKRYMNIWHGRQKNRHYWIPEIGQIVRLVNVKTPKTPFWPLGRIEQLFPDDRGVIRQVLLRTPEGERKRRAIKDLCALDLDLAKDFVEDSAEKRGAKALLCQLEKMMETRTEPEERRFRAVLPLEPPASEELEEWEEGEAKAADISLSGAHCRRLPQGLGFNECEDERSCEEGNGDRECCLPNLVSPDDLDVTAARNRLNLQQPQPLPPPSEKPSFFGRLRRKQSATTHMLVILALLALTTSSALAAPLNRTEAETEMKLMGELLSANGTEGDMGQNAVNVTMGEGESSEQVKEEEMGNESWLGGAELGVLERNWTVSADNGTENATQERPYVDEEGNYFPAADFHAQICLEGHEAVLISPPRPKPACQRSHNPEHVPHTPVTYEVFHPRHLVATTTAVYCSKTTSAITNGCLLGMKLRDVEITFEKVSVEECRNVSESGTFEGVELEQIDEWSRGTNRTKDPDCPYFWQSPVPEFVTNFFLENITLSSADMEHIQSARTQFPNKCQLQSDECEGKNFAAFWTHEKIGEECLYSMNRTVRGTLMGNRVVDENEREAFEVDESVDLSYFRSVCGFGENARATVEGAVLVINHTSFLPNDTCVEPEEEWEGDAGASGANGTELEEAESSGWGKPANDTLATNRTRTAQACNSTEPQQRQSVDFAQFKATLLEGENPENSRNHFIYWKMISQDRKILESVAFDLCQIERNLFNTNLMLLEIDASRAVRGLYRRGDLAATLRGDVLEVTRCQPVAIDVVYAQHRLPNGLCFRFTPVRLTDGSIYFLQPLSRDLIAFSEEIPCSLIKAPDVFRVSQGQFTERGVRESGIQGMLSELKKLEIVRDPRGFANQHHYQGSVIASAATAKMLSQAIHQLTLKQQGLININAWLTRSPNKTRLAFGSVLEVIGNAGQAVGGVLLKVRRELVGGFNDVIGGVGSAAESLLSAPMRILAGGLEALGDTAIFVIGGILAIGLLIASAFIAKHLGCCDRRPNLNDSFHPSHYHLR